MTLTIYLPNGKTLRFNGVEDLEKEGKDLASFSYVSASRKVVCRAGFDFSKAIGFSLD